MDSGSAFPPAPGGFSDNPGGMSASGGFGDPFNSAFPPAPGDSFGSAPDYSFGSSAMPAGDAWGSASAGGLSASGVGPAGATDFASAVAPSFDGSLSNALGSGDGAFGSDQTASMSGNFPAAFPAAGAVMGSDLLSANAPSMHDLETTKDQLVNAAVAAASGVMSNATKSSGSDAVFKITVTDPVKQGDGMRSYISYKINTKTTLPQYQWKEFSVIHRYKDFEWLWGQLKSKYEHIIIPPLPEKAVTGNFEPTFIQLRRGALEKFLQRVAAHPVLQNSEDLQLFLEANDETLQTAKATMSTKESATQMTSVKKQNKGFFQMLKETAQGISNSVGTVPEEFRDPAYEEQKLKIEELKNQVTNLQRYTMRLVFRMRELSVITTELGVACNIYAEIEQDRIANSFRRVGDANDKIGMMTGEHASLVEQELDAVLQENVLMLNAIGDLFTNRQNAIVALQTARSSHQAKLKQYESVKNNATKTGRAHELAAEISDAEADEKATRANYDMIKESMASELERFQQERVCNFRDMLMGYARCNAHYHREISERWTELLKDLEAEFQSM